MRRSATTFLVLVLVLNSCGGDDADSLGSTSLDGQAVTTTKAPTATTADPQGSAEVPFLTGFDQSVHLATATEGGGIRPRLEWESVPEADHYGVYLYAPDGRLYWSWRGRELSVYVGGAVQIGDHAAGPSVAVGMNWAVVAYGADLNPVAASGLRPIAP